MYLCNMYRSKKKELRKQLWLKSLPMYQIVYILLFLGYRLISTLLAPHETSVSCCHHRIVALVYNLRLSEQPQLPCYKICCDSSYLQGLNQVRYLKMPEWLSKRMTVKKSQCWNPTASSLERFSVSKIQKNLHSVLSAASKIFKLASHIFQEND